MSEELKIKSVAVGEGDSARVKLETADGSAFHAELNTADIASLIGILTEHIRMVTAGDRPNVAAMPEVHRLQVEETPGKVYLRLFFGPHSYHEYPIPAGSNFHSEMKLLADRLQARNAAKANSPGSGAKN